MAKKTRGIKFVCDLCGQLIEIGRPRFIMKGVLYCAYDGGQFDETGDGAPADFKAELERLIELAEQRSEKELNDEVHYAFEMDLCTHCRKKMYEMLDKAQFNEVD
ncbi:MAG: hypothetical protein GC154_16660 [bacterium]|nr:hypothetical protein [bacterium]